MLRFIRNMEAKQKGRPRRRGRPSIEYIVQRSGPAATHLCNQPAKATLALRRRMEYPTAPRPRIIIAHVAGSGTEAKLIVPV